MVPKLRLSCSIIRVIIPSPISIAQYTEPYSSSNTYQRLVSGRRPARRDFVNLKSRFQIQTYIKSAPL